MKINKLILGVAILVLLTSNVSAKRKNDAQSARAQNLAAVTVFVDVNSLTRKNMAASKMTKMHQQYAKEGYELVTINIYIENGDLQGFFVSYKQK